MAAAFHVYPQYLQKMATGSVKPATDTHRVILLTSYTYSNAHTNLSDIVGEVWKASTAYPLFSAAATTPYVQPTVPNGHWYRVTTAGTSGTTEPVWPTAAGATVTDGTIVWTESGVPVGSEVATGGGYTHGGYNGGQALTGAASFFTTSGFTSTLTFNNPSFSNATISAAYAIWFNSAPNGVAATTNLGCPLVAEWDFGGTQSSSNGTYTLTINASGLWAVTGT